MNPQNDSSQPENALETAGRTAARRTQGAIFTLMVLVIAGMAARMNEKEVRLFVYWATTFQGHQLAGANVAKLKPGDSFAECAATFSTDRTDDKKINVTCPDMVVIPAGKFLMGTGEYAGLEGPQHEVTIAKPFAVSRFTITFDHWDACVASGGCDAYRPTDDRWNRGSQPVIHVNWLDVQRYVIWLNRMTGSKDYRLLTEAEWEYAARAGNSRKWSFGDYDVELGDYAWYDDNSKRKTHPVGMKKPNAFGLYDMHGNVWQWVQDCRGVNYMKAPNDGTAAPEEINCARVVRGGSWRDNPIFLRSAYRYWYYTDERLNYLGFRVGRTLTP